jgi:hypothetical protein
MDEIREGIGRPPDRHGGAKPRRIIGSRLLAGLAALSVAIVVPTSSALAQGPGRSYEMVSPVAKNLGDVLRVTPVAEDGNTVLFVSSAAVDGALGAVNAHYSVARRTPGGWLRTNANPINERSPLGVDGVSLANAINRDFTEMIATTGLRFDERDHDLDQYDLYRIEFGTGRTTWLSHGTVLPDSLNARADFVWASDDLRHVVFSSPQAFPIIPEAAGSTRMVFERVGDTVRAVGYEPGSATPVPNAVPAATASARSGLGSAGFGGFAAPHGGAHGVSDDGRRIYWNAGTGTNAPLYLREDGARTIPVSISENDGVDAGAMRNGTFIAASPDGAIAYFTSASALTADAPATGTKVYRFSRLEEPGQRLALLTSTGGTVASAMASADGKVLYFTSTAVLAPGAATNQRNLYRWSDGQLTFIATIGNQGTIARVGRDGRYAVIATTASLGGAPNANRAALYVYDAVENELRCASCRPDGSPSNGDAFVDGAQTVPSAALATGLTKPRNLTDDGGLVFATTDRLVPEDVNEVADVYFWKGGEVTLVSSGTGESASYVADNTDDGTSIFFLTRDALVPEDTDNGVMDLYVARVGGGFPAPPGARTPCAEDACQGPGPNPPSLLSPRSDRLDGDGNVVPPDEPDVAPVTRTLRVQPLTASQRRRLARLGRTTLAVTVTGGGTVTARVRGRVRGRMRTLGTTQRTIRSRKTTTARLVLTLDRTGRRELRRAGRLQLTLEVRLSGAAGVKRTTVTLKRA